MPNGLILIGGESKRMGEPKHLLLKEGKPLYHFMGDLLQSCNIDPYISCRADQADSLTTDHPVIADNYSAIGPIGGIISAFETDSSVSWLVLACDLINLTKEAINHLIEADEGDEADVVTYHKQGSLYLETTLAIYRPSVIPKLNEAIESNEFSLQKVLKNCNVKTVETSGGFLKNVNTRGDYLNT